MGREAVTEVQIQTNIMHTHDPPPPPSSHPQSQWVEIPSEGDKVTIVLVQGPPEGAMLQNDLETWGGGGCTVEQDREGERQRMEARGLIQRGAGREEKRGEEIRKFGGGGGGGGGEKRRW